MTDKTEVTMKIWLFLLLMTGTCVADNERLDLDPESEESEGENTPPQKPALVSLDSSASSTASSTPLPSAPGTPSSSASKGTPWWLSGELGKVVMTPP